MSESTMPGNTIRAALGDLSQLHPQILAVLEDRERNLAEDIADKAIEYGIGRQEALGYLAGLGMTVHPSDDKAVALAQFKNRVQSRFPTVSDSEIDGYVEEVKAIFGV